MLFFDDFFHCELAYTPRPYSEAMAMRPSVSYIPCATSSKGKTGDVITFSQFEESNLLYETSEYIESDDKIGDKFDDNSNIPPLLSLEETDALDSGDESDDKPISTEMLEEICDGSQSHPDVNSRDARYKIRDRIKQIQSEWKGQVKATRNMGKGSHKVFKTAVKEILQYLPPLGESGSEVFHFIPEPRNFAEVTKLSDYIKKTWIKETQKEIKI